MINIGARFRARYTYTNLYVGFHPVGSQTHAMYGVGLGLRAPFGKGVALEFDNTVHGVHSLQVLDPVPSLVNSQRLMLSVTVVKPLRIWGGVTFNEMFEWNPEYGPTRPGYPYYIMERRLGDVNFRAWPGFVVGVEINPANGG